MDEARSLTYSINVKADTAEAEQNIRDLTGSLGDGGRITITVGADSSQAESNIRDITGGLGGLQEQASGVGAAFRGAFLSGIDSGDSFASSIRSGVIGAIAQAGDQAGSLGSAFSNAFRSGVESGGSLASSLRSGVGGALTYVGEQAGEFRDNLVEGAQKIGHGFAHPIETIKNGLGNAVQSAKDKFIDMARGADSAADSTDDLGDAANGAGDEMDDLGRATDDAGDAADQSGGKFEKFGGILKGVGVALVAVTAAVGAFAASSVGVGMEFDSSMSQVAATMGYSVEELNTVGSEANETFSELRSYAMEMGATTAFSANEAAGALNYMALAGYDAETSMTMLPNVLNLAAAGGIELAAASDMVTDAQSALGLSLDETSDLVDKMAMASSKSNTSVEQLGNAILAIGGTAKNLAGGTTELNAALGILADNGIKGAEGGTHLRNIILSLGSPTDTAAKALSDLGVSVFDAEGKMRPLNETFGDLNAALSTMSQGDRLAAIGDIFNTTDIASVNALLGTNAERWDELGLAIDGAWVNMGSLSESLSAVGLDLTDMQGKLGKLGISEKTFSDLLKTSGGNAEAFAGSLLEAADAGVSQADIISALGGNLTDLQTAFDSTTGAAQAMADTQLDNLAGDITLFKSALEGAQIVLSDQLTPNLREFVQFGSDAVSTLSTAFQEGGLSGAMGALGGILSDAVGMMIGMLPTLLDAGMQLLGALGEGLLSNVPLLIEAAAQIVVTLASGIGSALPELVPSVVETLLVVASTILENLPLLLDAGMQILGGLTEGILTAIPLLVEQLPELIMQIIGFLSENMPTILEQGSQMILSLGMGIIEALPQLISQLPAIISGMVGFFSENIPLIIETGVNLIVQLGVGLIQAIPSLVAQLPQIVAAIVGGFAEVPGMMLDIGKNIVQGVWNGISQMGSWIKEKVTGFFGGIVDGVKGLLGIKRPSTVFEQQVGTNMALGVGKGFVGAMGTVTKDIEKSIPTEFDLPTAFDFPNANAPDTDPKGAGPKNNPPDNDTPPQGNPPPPAGPGLPDSPIGITPQIDDVNLPAVPDMVYGVKPLVEDYDLANMAKAATYTVNPVIGDINTPVIPDDSYRVNPVIGEFNPPDTDLPEEYRLSGSSEGEGNNPPAGDGGTSGMTFAPVINVTVEGGTTEQGIENLREALYSTVRELYDEFRQEELEHTALKEQYAFQ